MMKQGAFLLLLALPALLTATTVTDRGCVGAGTPLCPGTLSDYSGTDAGELRATALAPIMSYRSDTGQYTLGGYLRSAVYARPVVAGSPYAPLTFFYQLETIDFPSAITSLVVLPQLLGGWSFPLDAGERSDAFGSFRPAPANAAYDSLLLNGDFLLASFRSHPVENGSVSATLEFQTDERGWTRAGEGSVSDAGNQSSIVAGGQVLIPLVNAPEPATWGLWGAGAVLLLTVAVGRNKRDGQ